MDAWIDCMGYLDDPESGMSQLTVEPNEMVVLELIGTTEFLYRRPDIFNNLLKSTTFVNQRRIVAGYGPILSLLFR